MFFSCMWIVTLYKFWFIDSFFQKHGLTLSGERRDPCPQNANPDANSCLASIFQNLPQGGHLCQVRPQGDRRCEAGQELSLLVVQWLQIQDTCEARNGAEQQQHEAGQIRNVDFCFCEQGTYISANNQWRMSTNGRGFQRMLNVVLYYLKMVQVLHIHLLQGLWWKAADDRGQPRDSRDRREPFRKSKIFSR